MKKGLVSVILPIYKVERYLERCILSVVEQSYTNLEIILVDDGSPDRCPHICDEWAGRDTRIKVIHKQNEGLGMARNSGLEIATGEYICFFDSDDYIVRDAIEKAYLLAKETSADIVTFGHGNIDKSGRIVNNVIPKTKKNVYEGIEIQKKFLPDLISCNPMTGENTQLHMSAWSSLYSVELIERANWRFVSEREIISEDIYSLLFLYKFVQKVAVLSEVLYFHCENETSLTNTYRKDRYEKICYFHKRCLMLRQEMNYSHEVIPRLNELFVSYTIAAMKMIVQSNENQRDKRILLQTIIGDIYLQRIFGNLDLKYTNLGRKILCICIQKQWYGIVYNLIRIKIKRGI